MKNFIFVFLLGMTAILSQTSTAQTCTTPTGLNANTIYDFQATLTWTAVPGATYYNIRYRIQGTTTFTNSSSSPASKVINSLLANTQYEFQVQASCSSAGVSSYSSLFQFTTTNTCSVPSNLGTAGVFPFYAYITWNAVPQALFYTTRYRKRDVSGPFQVGTNTSNVKGLGPLTQGTWYLFQASTNCPGGQSAYSNLDSFLTPCFYPVPYDDPGTFTETKLQIEGDTVIYRDTVSCKLLAALIDSIGGNALGITTVSNTANATVNTSVDPLYIYGRRAVSVTPTSNGRAKLILGYSQTDFNNYNANNPGYLDVPDYGDTLHPLRANIRIAKVVGSAKTYITPDSVRWIPSLNVWLVFLTQNAIQGDYHFFTFPDCAGVNISGLSVSNVLGSSFRANWTQLTTPAFGWYSLRYKPTGSSIWQSGGTSAYTTSSKLLVGLTPNTNYEVQIRFHCSSLTEGTWSSSVIFTTLNTCWASTSTTVTGITNNSVKINWTAAAGAVYYTIRHRKAVGPGSWITGTGTSTSKTISGLMAATTYDYQVGTNCAGWLSPLTAVQQFTTNAARPGIGFDEEAALKTSEIYLYPNPATDQLTISFVDAATNGYELTIVDLNGKVVSNMHIQGIEGNNEFTTDVSSLASGMYAVKLIGSTRTWTSKFVKE